jgi:peptidoglycan/xylan/chitin deacetylase (PgdA/CDA1 family)
MYHRVFETASDPWELCVSPKHFAHHLELLRRYYPVLSLHQLLRALTAGHLPKRGVVLTFDDGYADNLWNAKPLLEKYDLPATFFVASGSVDSPREFWWDDLERVLLQPRKLPKSLKLRIQGRSHEWLTADSDERQHAYMAIHRILQPLSGSDLDPVLTDILAWAGADRTGRPDYRPLTRAELFQLGQSELMDIGAHTVTHSFLSVLSPADQSAEIAGSRKKLEDIIGRRVETFSYPYGNFSAETIGIVAKAGFMAALTIKDNAVKVGANPLILGRFGVGNWDGDRFKHRLEEFFRC